MHRDPLKGMRVRDYLTLWQLARRRFDSGQDYQTFQQFQGRLLMTDFRSKGLSFEGQKVLDLGCSWGGYSQLFIEARAKVMSIDIETHPQVSEAVRNGLVVSNALALPVQAGQFDFVFCASLIEHVSQPSQLLAELFRVLRPGGRCYVGFPPFYSPAGGHQFKPFHLLGERVATILVGKGRYTFADLGGGWGLYRVTIGQVRSLLAEVGLVIDDISTKFLSLSPARMPLLGEFLTWYVQFLAHKPVEATLAPPADCAGNCGGPVPHASGGPSGRPWEG
jgi:SAM-dependent methyltransferase